MQSVMLSSRRDTCVLLAELRRVEVILTPPVESGPMVGWAFLSPEERDEADRIAGGKL
jgi:hypothetical protein